MRHLISISVICIIAIGCALDQAPVVRAEEKKLAGYDDYMEHCASCHGRSGRGDGEVAEILAIPLPDLTRLAWEKGGNFPEKYVRWAIDGRGDVLAHGPREMPIWGNEFRYELGRQTLPAIQTLDTTTEERIEDLVDYIRAFQRFEEKT